MHQLKHRIKHKKWFLDHRSAFTCLLLIPVSLVLSAAAVADEAANAHFLKQYWARPLASQGQAPKHFSPLEKQLRPQSCGRCHVNKYRNWQHSRHSLAGGPGILGQLIGMPAHEQQQCLRCHGPLKEQSDALLKALQTGSVIHTENQGAHLPLYALGVVCAACHMRGYKWYGPPPPKAATAPSPAVMKNYPHAGWTSEPAFKDSLFCAACHQSGANSYVLNGKPLENTYVEWKASRFARNNITCQRCHMPDRHHLWKGIHDPAMTRKGVSIKVSQLHRERGIVTALLTVTSIDVGHDFPTYVTPRVTLLAYQTHAGKPLAGTEQKRYIWRHVPLDLSRELSDTRLRPGQHLTLDYRQPLRANADTLVLKVRVEPDEFYSRFYRALLPPKGEEKRGDGLIRQALAESLASKYDLFTKKIQFRGKMHEVAQGRVGKDDNHAPP